MKKYINKDTETKHNVIDQGNLPNPVSNDNDLHIKDEVFEDDNEGHTEDKEETKNK